MSTQTLLQITRALRQRLEWEAATGAAAGVRPAPTAERQALLERLSALQEARRQRQLAALRGKPPEARVRTHTPAPGTLEAPRPPEPKTTSARPSVVAAPGTDAGADATAADAPTSDEPQASRSSQAFPAPSAAGSPPAPIGAGGNDVRKLMASLPQGFGKPRPRRPTPATAQPSPEESAMSAGQPQTPEEKLDWLRTYLGDCRRCGLCEGRSNVVFGTGSATADLVFIGEAPGYHEDQQGVPFVGKAGALLDKMIAAMGRTREDVYIANVLKCRPPSNRDPAPDEIAACSPFLFKQLEVIEPKIIVTLGRFAANLLLGSDESMGRLRGTWHDWRGIPLRATYHPAYLLRSPEMKGKAWEDLQQVMQRL